ncbi:ankyrin repeat domain-containing protein [Microbulbifer sp. JMSA004]|uniref:ankyrin repeat domain-containing protein n=1 Tax=unclassified Microbulbifer TaxID=2619833 RepID=UPI0024ADA82D|nr:ankyrin repeat domain-containing protein [Microbulbifer sp. VAAF005]WHI46417.1 ankyrin repeat domain-containing protein [Microbulbifer sp. VAAF005]
MDQLLRKILDDIQSVPDFSGTDLKDINDTNAFGDNALHCVCVWGDIDAAKLLVENGINIEQKGEGGFTPLKVADDFEHFEIVRYLISKGANVEALEAEFQFDREANSQHMSNLQESIKELEQKVKNECGKNS